MENKLKKILVIIMLNIGFILFAYSLKTLLRGESESLDLKEFHSALYDRVKADEDYKGAKMEVNIKILYDNTAINKQFEKGWGFSCLINDSVLFDAGESWDKLEKNMARLSVNTDLIKYVVLSHKHYDHTGGIEGVLNKSVNVKGVFIPVGADAKLMNSIKKYEVKTIIIDSAMKISENFYSSGAIACDYKNKPLFEQALIISCDNELAIITGCAHPGILNIVNKVKTDFANHSINFFLGGFHLFEEFGKNTSSIGKELINAGVGKIAPCHCTGKNATKIFKALFGDKYIKIGAGSVLTLQLGGSAKSSI